MQVHNQHNNNNIIKTTTVHCVQQQQQNLTLTNSHGVHTSVYTLFISWKSFILFKKTVVFATWSRDEPAAWSTASRLASDWRACDVMHV